MSSHQINDTAWMSGYQNHQVPSTATADQAYQMEQGRLQRQAEEAERMRKASEASQTGKR